MPFEKLATKFTRAALRLFGEGEPQLRVQAVLLLRALLLALPAAGVERVLRGLYRTFSANAKFVNAASLEHIAFMARTSPTFPAPIAFHALTPFPPSAVILCRSPRAWRSCTGSTRRRRTRSCTRTCASWRCCCGRR